MVDTWGIKAGLLIGAFTMIYAARQGYVWVLDSYPFAMVEDCTNGLDDDRDGWVDLNDPDCVCTQVKPISLIPNPSFEDKNCCPGTRSQLSCANGWIQASEATTDYLHTCSWMGPEEFIVPLPIPDGEGFVGLRDGRVTSGGTKDPGWKEYAGACLLSPLRANITYRFEFYLGFSTPERSPSIEISFFGTTDCKNLPFGKGDELFGCPTHDTNWEYLASKFVSGGVRPNWVKTEIVIRPRKDMAAVAIGPSCRDSENPLSTYYYFDNLVLADSRDFPPQIAAVGHPCNKLFALQVANKENVNFQWYKEGIALIGETGRELKSVPGEGKYQVRVEDLGNCMVSEPFEYKIPRLTKNIEMTICKGETYTFGGKVLNSSGYYTHVFRSINDCDSTVNLQLIFLGELRDSVNARILKGDDYVIGDYRLKDAGRHQVSLQNKYGCDSLVVVDLEYLKVLFPNIIKVGSTGGNDQFKPVFDEEAIASIDFKFYDRWGNLVHEGLDWDGSSSRGTVVSGVYIYQATVHLKSGGSRLISGDFLFLE